MKELKPYSIERIKREVQPSIENGILYYHSKNNKVMKLPIKENFKNKYIVKIGQRFFDSKKFGQNMKKAEVEALFRNYYDLKITATPVKGSPGQFSIKQDEGSQPLKTPRERLTQPRRPTEKDLKEAENRREAVAAQRGRGIGARQKVILQQKARLAENKGKPLSKLPLRTSRTNVMPTEAQVENAITATATALQTGRETSPAARQVVSQMQVKQTTYNGKPRGRNLTGKESQSGEIGSVVEGGNESNNSNEEGFSPGPLVSR